MDLKALTRAAAALKRLYSEYQEREALLAVFRSAEQTINTLIAAEAGIAEAEKQKAELEGQIRDAALRLDKARSDQKAFLKSDEDLRADVAAETERLLAEASSKRIAAKTRLSTLDEDYKTAKAALDAELAAIQGEISEASATLAGIKEHIAKFKALAE